MPISLYIHLLTITQRRLSDRTSKASTRPAGSGGRPAEPIRRLLCTVGGLPAGIPTAAAAAAGVRTAGISSTAAVGSGLSAASKVLITMHLLCNVHHFFFDDEWLTGSLCVLLLAPWFNTPCSSPTKPTKPASETNEAFFKGLLTGVVVAKFNGRLALGALVGIAVGAFYQQEHGAPNIKSYIDQLRAKGSGSA